jgi:hypothetical protein
MSTNNFVIAVTAIEAAAIAIGFIGNIISIIVFSRKTFRNNSISTYCISLAIAEFLAIFQFINIVYYFPYNAYLVDLSEAFCKIADASVNLVSAIPPFIMIAFSVDKLLSMRTSQIAILKKKSFQWSLVAGITLFHIALYMYFPILVKRTEIFPGYFFCDVSTIGFLTIHMFLIILETCLIPFVILMITTILTIRLLLKSSNTIERMGKLTKERKSRDRKYAITSVTLNINLIVLKLPLTIFYILFSFYSYYDVYYLNIASLLFYLNTSLGFFIHFVTNSLFRKEFLILFRVIKRNGESSATGNSSRTNRPIRINQISTMQLNS